jgi:hypothetical protein
MNPGQTVATDKAKLFAYVDPQLKAKIERLADIRLRSVSKEVARAEQEGVLPTHQEGKQ